MRRLRTTGEFLSSYLRRLEGADDQRIRVDSDTSDNKGNVIVQPVLMLGRDPNDDIRPARMDTTGRLDVVGVVPTMQPQIAISIAPASGVRNLVLDTTEFVRVLGIMASVTWTVQPTPLEVHLTIDGVNMRFLQVNPNSGTAYIPALLANNVFTEQPMETNTNVALRRSFLIEGRSVKIEAETTGGTVSNLKCRVLWEKW